MSDARSTSSGKASSERARTHKSCTSSRPGARFCARARFCPDTVSVRGRLLGGALTCHRAIVGAKGAFEVCFSCLVTRIRAAPLVRVKAKFTVKNVVRPSLPFAAYGVLTVNLAFTLTIGAALSVAISHLRTGQPHYESISTREGQSQNHSQKHRCRRRLSHTTFLTVILALTLKSEVALTIHSQNPSQIPSQIHGQNRPMLL